MLSKIVVVIVGDFAIIVIVSCKKSDPVCDGSQPTYQSVVKSIIDNNCLSCHGSGSSRNFTTYQGLKLFLDNGRFRKLVLQDQTMPKGPAKLSQDELNKIQCWVDTGYPGEMILPNMGKVSFFQCQGIALQIILCNKWH